VNKCITPVVETISSCP